MQKVFLFRIRVVYLHKQTAKTMKTTIEITGQLHGNLILKNAIANLDSNIKDLDFGCFSIEFDSLENANRALKEAQEFLRSKGLLS